MKRIESLSDLEVILKNSGSCLFGEAQDGHATPDETITAIEDFTSDRVIYFADPSQKYGYVRAFYYDGELVVDFGRPLEELAENIFDLAQSLGCKVILPMRIPGVRSKQIPHIDTLPVSRDTRWFDFKSEHPRYRVSFPYDGEYEVLVFDPDEI